MTREQFDGGIRSGRPVLIWVSLGFIAFSALTGLLSVYQAIAGLNEALGVDIFLFVLQSALCVVLVLTYDAVVRATDRGRRLGILSFSLLGVLSIYSAVVVTQWYLAGLDSHYMVIAQAIVALRLGLSFFLAAAFGVSKTVERYFGGETER